jgi:hypothetical protein
LGTKVQQFAKIEIDKQLACKIHSLSKALKFIRLIKQHSAGQCLAGDSLALYPDNSDFG